MDKIKMIMRKSGETLKSINKLSLPVTILIASIILGGFYYTSQVSKQNSIEKQQQIDLQAKAIADQAKAEKDKADTIFNNNLKCQALLKDLKQRWSNVVGIYYQEAIGNSFIGLFDEENTCIVKYTIKGKTMESPIGQMQDIK